jgi:hypothetical protein
MQLPNQKEPNIHYLAAGAGAIFLLSVWGASFSRTCQSDGCIGIVFPVGAAFIALLVQLFVVIPFYCFKRRKLRLSFGAMAAAWAGGSLAAFVIPLLFAKL